jgi:hypothetical protein
MRWMPERPGLQPPPLDGEPAPAATLAGMEWRPNVAFPKGWNVNHAVVWMRRSPFP